ncbi:TetR family transcriptional regulator [Actinoplanes sp. LDG1-06]|uniref:TetR family transcriptional regulator n=2 Tax=Paractinoplanes ovalisporus TaxID=2810368 RepID=A0ABS2AL74_9ACTN|nr:TetR family transcriptional regulator [Actinoplanes ovalisporus]
MTMKGIAERAGVGRQTVYRWWPTKAHILIEACAADARGELAVTPSTEPARTVTDFLDALSRFLTDSPAGAAYRALLGEAQHDPAVRDLMAQEDLLAAPARVVLDSLRTQLAMVPLDDEMAVAELCGPLVLAALSGRRLKTDALAAHLVHAWA